MTYDVDQNERNAVAALEGEPVSTVVDLHPGHELDLLRGLRDGAWLDAQDFPPLRYAVPGLIPEGSTLLVGPPKIGKSWFVLSVALAVASGGRALGQLDVDARPVLYLALEDGHRRMQDRCRMLLEGDAIPAGFNYMTTIERGMALETVRQWLERFGGSEPLVILDTLGKVMPPALMGESAYQRDYRVGSALKKLADEYPGACLLTNHHDRKAGSDDFVDSVSGTHGLAGAADTILVLNRARHESSGLVKVTGRDVAEGEYTLRFDAGARWLVDGADLTDAARNAQRQRAVAGLSDRSADVLTFVGEHPEGVNAAQVSEALDLEANQTRVYLSRLHESGRVLKPKRGLYTPVASVAVLLPEDSKRNNATVATPLQGSDW